ncbi:murein hydrolase activator EnvC family protein [Sinimarinibacterium thermocellulolyticum]|uniref:Peptidoglycan DD-metalloendopeptidase family protein n=1 Tax=Sinimarinibacterium thermocellulolyticum TaxID=3170016 RepID=A0ABV2A8V8_9GAMM
MIRPAALVVTLLCVLCGDVLAASADLRERQATLDKLRSRIDELAQSIEKDQNQRDALARELQSIERRIAAAEAERASVQQQVEAQRARIHDTEQQLVASRRTLDQRHRTLAQQLRAAYVIGRQGQVQLLLNQNDVQRIGRMLVYYEYLQRAQAGAIEAIRSRVDELEAVSERLQAEIARLTELKSRQEAALQELRESRGARARALAKLRARIVDEKSELERLRSEERSIRELIERVEKTLSELPPPAPSSDRYSDNPLPSLRGKLPWPARGKLIARYGDAKAGGKLTWKGHWIGTAEGAPVKAVARGRVVYVGWLHRYGLIVLLEHDGGYYSLYGHAQSATVKVGDTLRAGQVVARAGTTGGHEQPGVYFELRKGTQAVDPGQWLTR